MYKLPIVSFSNGCRFQIVRYNHTNKRAAVVDVVDERFHAYNELESLVVDYIRGQDGAAKANQPFKNYLYDLNKFMTIRSTLANNAHYVTRNVEDHVNKLTIWKKYEKTRVLPGRMWGTSTVTEVVYQKLFDFDIVEVDDAWAASHQDDTTGVSKKPTNRHPLAVLMTTSPLWCQLQTVMNESGPVKLSELRTKLALQVSKIPPPPPPPPLPMVATIKTVEVTPELVRDAVEASMAPNAEDAVVSSSPASSIKRNSYMEELLAAKNRARGIAEAAAAMGAQMEQSRRLKEKESESKDTKEAAENATL